MGPDVNANGMAVLEDMATRIAVISWRTIAQVV
jgi:hypothetical protein